MGAYIDTFVQANQNAGAPTSNGATENQRARSGSNILDWLSTGVELYDTVADQSTTNTPSSSGVPLPSQAPGASVRPGQMQRMVPWIIGGVALLVVGWFFLRK